jgi:hypothetical protein
LRDKGLRKQPGLRTTRGNRDATSSNGYLLFNHARLLTKNDVAGNSSNADGRELA